MRWRHFLAGTIDEARAHPTPVLCVSALATATLVLISWIATVAVLHERERQEAIEVAAALTVRSSELRDTDSRLAALTALAADRLHSSDATRSAVFNAVQANQAAVRTVQAQPDGPVIDLASSGDVVLSAGKSPLLKAWSFPEMKPLGDLAIDGNVRGMLATGASQTFAVADRSSLRIFQGARGRVPVEVKNMALPDAAAPFPRAIFGPYFDSASGAYIVIDEEFEGVYWAPGMAEEIRFDVSDRPGLLGRATAVAGTGFGTLATWWSVPSNGLNVPSVLLGTSKGQVIRVRIGTAADRALDVTAEPLVQPTDVAAPITALGYASDNTIYIGTERGIQLWDVAAARLRAFPYAGIADRIVVLIPIGAGVVALTPTAVKLGTASGTVVLHNVGTAAAGAGVHSIAPSAGGESQLLIGRNDGRILVLDPEHRWLGPEDRPGSNVAAFTPDTELVVTSDGPQRTSSLTVTPISGSDQDKHKRQYLLPSTRYDSKPYVNDAQADDRFVVASGQNRETGTGRVWVWDAKSAKLVADLDFPAKADTYSADMVTRVAIAPSLETVVGINPALGAVGLWSTRDWKLTKSIPLVSYVGPKDRMGFAMTSSADGTRLLVRVIEADTDTTRLVLIDVREQKIVRDMALDAHDAYLSPDGRKIAVSATERDMTIYDDTGAKLTDTLEMHARIEDVSWKPDGTRLALSISEVGEVVFVDSARMKIDGPPWNTAIGTVPLRTVWSADGTYLAVASGMRRNDGQLVPKAVQLFRPGNTDWTDALCAVAGTDFADEEWRAVAGDSVRRPVLCG
ncbi:WD40 repeat domain-containing protein [Nocardia wallacei]|uniref:WD40 repeat domain-containing protein n=1 Tax=Nocardia wallacei TaxID=480035 RepID=UPI0024552008|nr:WD40 repeat domain-containing protein [Nocardia wallacei]